MKRTRNANKIYNIQNNYFFAGSLVPCAVSLLNTKKNIKIMKHINARTNKIIKAKNNYYFLAIVNSYVPCVVSYNITNKYCQKMNYLSADNSHISEGIIKDYFLGTPVGSDWNRLHSSFHSNISEVKLETKRSNNVKIIKKFQLKVRRTAKELMRVQTSYKIDRNITCEAFQTKMEVMIYMSV